MKKDQSIIDFLKHILPPLAEVPFSYIETEAAARDISKWQLYRAKRKLNVVVFKERKMDGRWFWLRHADLR